MPLSLFDDIRRKGFHSSIMTTFSVDPAFYDANVQFRLRSAGCQNNLLLADAAMLQQALEQLPEAFAQAGRKYLIAPVPVARGCFHPKVTIRYGKAKASMILGSANATSAAWGSNRELVSTFHWSEGSDSSDAETHRGLIASAHDWLLSRLPSEPDQDLHYKLDLLATQSPWLADCPRSEGVAELSDGTLVGLLLSAPGMPQGIAARFLDEVEGEVERLTIISPYWDDDLGALRRLHHDLGEPSTHVFLTLADKPAARQSTFPIDAPSFGSGPRFHPLGEATRQRFLHAKLILAQTQDHDYLLYGSANCTNAALGAAATPGPNCEAAVFRRLARETTDGALGLDYSREIARQDISTPEQREAPTNHTASFDPGRIEKKGDRLMWSCPRELSPQGASLLMEGARLAVEMLPGVRPFARLDAAAARGVTVVRVELADGQISRPVIVSHPDMLMAAAPHPLADNLRRRLNDVLNGEADLITLARDVHLLFEADDERSQPRPRSGSGGRRRSTPQSMLAGQDFETPEEFRAALNLSANLHASSIAHADNPTLQLLLQIVLRGIVQLENSVSLDLEDARDAEALNAGEDQDDVGEGDGGDNEGGGTKGAGDPAAEPPPRPKPALGKPVSVKAVEKNRAALGRALNRFEGYLETLAESEQRLDLDFVTRALFMLNMMIHGCVHRYAVEGEEDQTLYPFSAIGTRKQEQGFLMRAAKLMTRIWGRKFDEGLMARVNVDREETMMPLPLATLIILSRWILAAILVEARQARGAKSFSTVLEAEVPRFWRMTSMFGPIDPEQVENTVEQLAKLVRMDQARSRDIIAEVRVLGFGEASRHSHYVGG